MPFQKNYDFMKGRGEIKYLKLNHIFFGCPHRFEKGYLTSGFTAC